MSIIFLKKVMTGVVLTGVLFGFGLSSDTALASTTTNQYAQSEWNQYKLDSNAISKNGKVYLPLRSAFGALGADIKWKPEGQNTVEVYAKDKAFLLYIKEEGGNTYLSGTQNTKGESMLFANGNAYVSTTSLQTLVNRTLTVSGNTLTTIDYQPNWKNGDNQNALWKGNLSAVNKPVLQPKAEVVATPAPAPVSLNAVAAAPVAKKEVAKVAPVAVKEAASPNAASLLVNAKSYIGVPYVWGGTSPQGFDCSGLTTYVYKNFGINLPRTAAEQQNFAKPVGLNELVPGDLVFWGEPAYHVGIYMGEGKYVHAAWSGQVEIGQYEWFPYTGAGRVM